MAHSLLPFWRYLLIQYMLSHMGLVLAFAYAFELRG